MDHFLRHLLETVALLEERGIRFRSLQEAIDTTTSGRLSFHIFGALAELERNLIRERTLASLRAARARGRTGIHCSYWYDLTQYALTDTLPQVFLDRNVNLQLT